MIRTKRRRKRIRRTAEEMSLMMKILALLKRKPAPKML